MVYLTKDSYPVGTPLEELSTGSFGDVHYKDTVFEGPGTFVPHYPATVILPYGAGRAGKFRADILVEKGVVVENKAMNKITKQDEAQLINYLKTTRLRVGLLFNFGAEKFEIIRRMF